MVNVKNTSRDCNYVTGVANNKWEDNIKRWTKQQSVHGETVLEIRCSQSLLWRQHLID